MPETLGTRLRLQRQRLQIDLTAIAERTKIKASLLEELECDNVSHWPAGIFRRAFLRSYAQAIGLDPDPVVREFLELHPDPDEVTSAVVLAPLDPDTRPVSGAPPTRLGCLLRSSMAALTSRRAQVPRVGPRPCPCPSPWRSARC
jgi:transcriptional regulator with XRE-family HTH domain